MYYGDDFKFLAPQEQFVSDHFWNRAIPTEQEIKEIEIEKGTLDVITPCRLCGA